MQVSHILFPSSSPALLRHHPLDRPTGIIHSLIQLKSRPCVLKIQAHFAGQVSEQNDKEEVEKEEPEMFDLEVDTAVPSAMRAIPHEKEHKDHQASTIRRRLRLIDVKRIKFDQGDGEDVMNNNAVPKSDELKLR